MNLPFLKKTSKDTNKFLTLDIGAEAVNCLAFYADTSGIAKIIGVGNRGIDRGAVRSGIIVDMEKVLEATYDAIAEATEDLEDDILDVIIGISGDLSIGFITTAKSTKPSAAEISGKEIEKVTQMIMDNASIKARNELLQITGATDVDIEPIMVSTIYSKVDGKQTLDPLGLSGASLEMAVYTAFSPSYHVRSLEKLAKKLGLNILALGPTMFSIVNSLRYSGFEHNDYVVMDVGSDFTEIGAIFSNGIISARSFHIGGYQFTEEISYKLGLNLKEAENMKLNYSYRKLSNSEARLVQNAISETLDLWLSGVQLSFEEFSGVKTFASNVYLVGGGVKLPDLFEYISSEPWTKGIAFKSPPEIDKLSMETLKRVSDSTGRAEALEYFVPASLSIIYLGLKGLLNDQN